LILAQIERWRRA